MSTLGGNFIPPDKQKRNTARLRIGKPAEFRFAGEQRWSVCTLNDVSIGGVSLEGNMSFYVGDKIDLRFTLDGRTLIAKLEITNIAGKKAGGRFESLMDSDLEFIREYLNSNLFSEGQSDQFR
jgi:hypothetical protein